MGVLKVIGIVVGTIVVLNILGGIAIAAQQNRV